MKISITLLFTLLTTTVFANQVNIKNVDDCKGIKECVKNLTHNSLVEIKSASTGEEFTIWITYAYTPSNLLNWRSHVNAWLWSADPEAIDEYINYSSEDQDYQNGINTIRNAITSKTFSTTTTKVLDSLIAGDLNHNLSGDESPGSNHRLLIARVMKPSGIPLNTLIEGSNVTSVDWFLVELSEGEKSKSLIKENSKKFRIYGQAGMELSKALVGK